MYQLTEMLTANDRMSKGRVSKKASTTKAEAEYDISNKTQKVTSNSDREVKRFIDSQ